MKLPAVVLGLVLLGAGATWLNGERTAGSSPAGSVPSEGLYTVARGALTVTLTENGTLVAKDSRKISANIRGNAKITFLVDEGLAVEEEEVVCRLDSTEQEDRLEQREMDVVQATADLATARTELEIQQAESIASLEKAAIALEKATAEEERYRDGDAPKEKRKLTVAIKETETEYTRSKKRYEDSQFLMTKNYINKSQLEEDQIKFERAEVQRDSAHNDLELFERYTLPLTRAEREASLRDAQRGQETTAKRSESALLQRTVAVEKNEKRLKSLEKQVAELKEDIEKMTLKAPSPGIVIYGDPQRPWQRDEIRVGGDVWGDMTLLTIPDLRVMQVKLRVHEADISKVAAGQKAKVTMDSYPGVVLDGQVSRIAAIASGENRWDENPEVKKFDIEITLDTAADLVLKPGISAKAEIFIDRKENVLFVPIQCVFIEEGRHLCYVLDDMGAPVATAVTPGLSNETSLEILAGLQEGQRVLLYNPSFSSTDESAKKPSKADEPEDEGVEVPAEEAEGIEVPRVDGEDAGAELSPVTDQGGSAELSPVTEEGAGAAVPLGNSEGEGGGGPSLGVGASQPATAPGEE